VPIVTGGSGSPDGESCKGASAEANEVPVDVFMMIDQSISMAFPNESGQSRWVDVISALTQFVQAPESAGLSIGVQYFGLVASCNAPDYAKAEVEIAALPANAAPLVASFMAHGPSDTTPTAAAIQGGVQHAQAWKAAHPTHTVVVLLVTDGEPDAACAGGLVGAVQAATAGLAATPSVPTYVLGVGLALDALNQIATAGGTKQAYIVSGTANVSAQVVTALNTIRGMAVLPCEFQIPEPAPGSEIDFDKVNLTYTPTGGVETPVGHAADRVACDAAPLAWRFDDDAKPTKFVLCDTACKTVAGGGKIALSLQCPTIELN
jgi:hypothetical protein